MTLCKTTNFSKTPSFVTLLPLSSNSSFTQITSTNRTTTPISKRHRQQNNSIPCALIEQLNRFEIKADLDIPNAKGSFGEVFFGNLSTGEPVVLKKSLPDRTAKLLFRKERAINKKIAIPNTCQHWPQFLGDYFKDSQTFLVWRRIGNGDTLHDYLFTKPQTALQNVLGITTTPATKLNVEAFRIITKSLLLALKNLHAQGVVHRDVKPANILLVPKTKSNYTNWTPLRLIDFGSSCDVGNILWTRGIDTLDPLYAAPEKRLSLLAPEKFDVFSAAMIGISVLIPEFCNETRLREFRLRLEACDFDLRKYRDDIRNTINKQLGGTSIDDGLLLLFDINNQQTADIFSLLNMMLKKSPTSRISIDAALLQVDG